MDDQKKKYQAHKNSASQRGIDFDLSFEEWKEIWDGKYEDRGRGTNQFGMLRTRDEGGYTVGNVRIGTPKENQAERGLVEKVKRVPVSWVASGQRRIAEPSQIEVFTSRNRVFDEYIEDDEEIY